YVRSELAARLPGIGAERAGLAIFTSLDVAWQAGAETALTRAVADLEREVGRRAAPLQGAFVALDPASGRVRAMVGGRGAQSGDFNRAFQARRQPGSAIKPVVYAAALDSSRRGPAFTPASTVPDERRAFDTPEGPWKP